MKKYSLELLQQVCEGALMTAGSPLSISRLLTLFDEECPPSEDALRQALDNLKQDCERRGIELIEVASGFRLQVKAEIAGYVSRLWEEKPQRYSRALLETLALIAYRQPITRGDIEDVRGVVVSSAMVKTLLEREWIRVVGYRDVPGRPAMYATTNEFLDYFGLKSLDQLPSLIAIKELDDANRQLDLDKTASADSTDHEERPPASAEEIAERGAEVMAATDQDLADASRLLKQVEDNVYEQDDESGGRKVRDLGQILSRLAEADSESESNQDQDQDQDQEQVQAHDPDSPMESTDPKSGSQDEGTTATEASVQADDSTDTAATETIATETTPEEIASSNNSLFENTSSETSVTENPLSENISNTSQDPDALSSGSSLSSCETN